jgi:hypothetical protein
MNENTSPKKEWISPDFDFENVSNVEGGADYNDSEDPTFFHT